MRWNSPPLDINPVFIIIIIIITIIIIIMIIFINFFLYKEHYMEHWSKIQSNLNTLKTLTKKLSHFSHIKWYRRCKFLTFQSTNICFLYFFADSHKKKAIKQEVYATHIYQIYTYTYTYKYMFMYVHRHDKY